MTKARREISTGVSSRRPGGIDCHYTGRARYHGGPMSLASLRAFAFDLDGCIWAGPTLLPGAAELVGTLRQAGRRVLFVTNSSRELAASIADRLTRLGIPTLPGEVLSALDLLGETIH